MKCYQEELRGMRSSRKNSVFSFQESNVVFQPMHKMQVRLETATSSSTVRLIKPRLGCPDACPCCGKWRAGKGLSNASHQLHQTQTFLLLADQAQRLAQGAGRTQGTRLSGKEGENTLGKEPVETRGRFFLLRFKCQRQNLFICPQK